MSKKSQGVLPETQPATTLSPETIEALKGKMMEFFQALSPPEEEEPDSPETPAFKSSPQENEPDQIRCYRVPGFIAREEQATMREHRATDLLDLLHKAHENFFITSFLLRNFDLDEEVTGFRLQQIGLQLEYPIRMLNRACSLLGDFRPVPSAPEASDA
jgi:hypothetical protein